MLGVDTGPVSQMGRRAPEVMGPTAEGSSWCCGRGKGEKGEVWGEDRAEKGGEWVGEGEGGEWRRMGWGG